MASVFRRKGSRFWWVKRQAWGEDLRYSTKTTDRSEAERIAKAWTAWEAVPTEVEAAAQVIRAFLKAHNLHVRVSRRAMRGTKGLNPQIQRLRKTLARYTSLKHRMRRDASVNIRSPHVLYDCTRDVR